MPIRRQWRTCVAAAMLLASAPAAAQRPDSSEAAVKAAFLYNFTKFVEWPGSAFPQPSTAFVVCAFADGAFRKEFIAYTRQERVLRVLLEKDKRDVLSKQVLDQLRADSDSDDFVNKVQKQITGRNARVEKKRPPSSRRKRTVRLRPRANKGNPWALPMGIAAMLMVGVALFVYSQKQIPEPAPTVVALRSGMGVWVMREANTAAWPSAWMMSACSKVKRKASSWAAKAMAWPLEAKTSLGWRPRLARASRQSCSIMRANPSRPTVKISPVVRHASCAR